MNIEVVSNDLNGITIMDFAKYLGFKGFKRRKDFKNENLFAYRKILENGHNLDIVIPSREDFIDYYKRLQESIEILSKLEGKSILSVIEEIRKPNVDKLQIRVISDFSEEGAIPLSYAATFVSALKDLIVASACAEEIPEPFYNRALKRATDYADTVRFGQTRKGSFVATIESDVPVSNFTQLSIAGTESENQQMPFSRRVIQRIQFGVSQIENAILNGGVEELLENGYKTGLNANMCDALLKLKAGTGNMKFEYRVDWSPVLPAPKNISEKVTIERNGLDFIRTLAEKYRGSIESKKILIEGTVVGLSAEDIEEDNEGDRKVTVKVINNTQNIKKVKLNMTVEDYKKACDAHKDGLFIRVEGILEREGKQWVLSGVENFKIIGSN